VKPLRAALPEIQSRPVMRTHQDAQSEGGKRPDKCVCVCVWIFVMMMRVCVMSVCVD